MTNMAYWESEVVVKDRQLFPKRVGEIVADLVALRWPSNRAKSLERHWRVDRKTAENITKGHFSTQNLQRAVEADGWEFLEALGHAMTGQTYAEWQEARLNEIIQETQRVSETVQRICARSRLLDAASGGGVLPEPRSVAAEPRRVGGGDRR